MNTSDKDAPVNNFGTIQTERNARGTARPYDPAERRYGPQNAPPPKRDRPREQLEAYDGPIPDKWTAKHVGRRLIDAFNVLHRMPPLPSPKEPGNAMPDVRDPEDVKGQSTEDRWEELMRLTARPTRLEITRMEAAFEWLANLRRHDSGMALQLMFWANHWARRRDIRRLCIEQKWAWSTFYRKIDSGKAWIARDLNSRGVVIY